MPLSCDGITEFTTDTFTILIINYRSYIFIVLLSGVLPIITTAPTLDDGIVWVSVNTKFFP
jgi:hypothetical protein